VRLLVHRGSDAAHRHSLPPQRSYLREDRLFAGIGLEVLAVARKSISERDVTNPLSKVALMAKRVARPLAIAVSPATAP
jgi:hypothetical protein